MKQSTIQIHDARRKGGKGYRVKSVAKNGEILQVSEVLESENAVKKNILAMEVLFNAGPMSIEQMRDHTKTQIFVKKGWAKAAKK
jgi:hypothetical protein